MIIFWNTRKKAQVSTDPGVANVRAGIAYIINDVDLIGEMAVNKVVACGLILTGQNLGGMLTGNSVSGILEGEC